MTPDAESDARAAATVASASTAGSARLVDGYDGLILDLDGVVYVGDRAVPGAVEAIAEVKASGRAITFATNNASRTPQAVAGQLLGLGIDATAEQVVTSAQAAAGVLARTVAAGSRVLVVGGEGLRSALEERGLVPVSSADDHPVAVVQGFAPELGWSLLAEGAYALATGVPWVASNVDLTIPTARGIAPGNGALVSALAFAAGRRPSVVAGKPERPLFDECLQRMGARRCLVVGDRLDTDIAGARAAGLDSVAVLTGVTTSESLLAAPPEQRPTYLVASLVDVIAEPPRLEISGEGVGSGTVRAWIGDGSVRVSGNGPPIDMLRAVTAVWWRAQDTDAVPVTVPPDVLRLLP
jgi:HAD superfamily hydrolase (TIGR01450 family)